MPWHVVCNAPVAMDSLQTPRPAPGPTLETLMDRYVDGDQAAFAELYQRVSPKLYGYLLRLSRDRALAEDVLQTTFAKIHRARHAYVRGAAVVPWVLVIARRTFFDERRSAAARWEVLSDDGVLPESDTPVPDAVPDLAEDIARAMESLPAHYRAAIELTKLSGLSGTEAARALQTTRSAVKLRVHRGYKLLREMLGSPPAGDAFGVAVAA
jgi:RNA polymerase sigma-70 factor, ECF subfamily